MCASPAYFASTAVRKPRILWCTESSFLNTGYSTYANEVLKRLHATGKYELFELGAYGPYNDPRAGQVPWNYMPVRPNPDNPEECRRYGSDQINQFGAWKFEESCLWALPDIVCDYRDQWCFDFEAWSPFRPFYYWALMPACDAAPQSEGWINTFLQADAVLTYTDWAQEVLRKQSCGKLKLRGTATPGADLDTFKPKPNKRAHRAAMGIDEDCFIVGTANRNQKRKLFPDLLRAFRLFLDAAPEDLAKKTFLYLHTSWPDLGWDIPLILTETGLGQKTLFTYMCKRCGAAYPDFFKDAKAVCRNCKNPTATLTNSGAGVSRDTLNEIFNLWDVYVQYASSEGLGIAQVEAAATGAHVFSVEYSGMEDVINKLGATPIKVKRFFRESETHCWRALPDDEDFANKLIKHLLLPEPVRARLAFETRRAVENHFTYEKAAKAWMDVYDGFALRSMNETWGSPPRYHQPAPLETAPQGLTNEQFVLWGLINVAGMPELINSYLAMRMVRDLNWEATVSHMGGLYFNEMSTLGTMPRYEPFNRERCYEEMRKLAENRNHWERRRDQRRTSRGERQGQF